MHALIILNGDEPFRFYLFNNDYANDPAGSRLPTRTLSGKGCFQCGRCIAAKSLFGAGKFPACWPSQGLVQSARSASRRQPAFKVRTWPQLGAAAYGNARSQ